MRAKYYIENRKPLALITEALNLAAQPQSYVLKELQNYIVTVKAARRFDWESTNTWDCGRQDAMGARLDHIWSRWNALKLARRIQRGDATQLKGLMDKVIGVIV